MSDPPSETLGCAACLAVPATRDDMRLEQVRNLFEAPHEGYAILCCGACGQPFLEQFQEVTGLPSGEDDIWLRWMPLTPEELTEVEQLQPTETDADRAHLAKLMHRRGRLVCDPLGRFKWSEEVWDVGNRYPPG